MREAIINLLNSDLSSNYIAKQTGVEQSTIYRLRSGERKLDNLGLSKCEKLYEYEMERIKMNKLSYVVEMSRLDKALEITTKEYDSFYLYEISPEWLKDKDYIFGLIKDEDLNSKFTSEEIEEPTQLEYTLQEVKDYLESL